MNRVLTASPSGSTKGAQAIVPIPDIPSTAVGGATSDRVPTAAIRHALRALASETGPLTGRGVKLLRPLVAQAQEVLRERLEAGGSVEAYLRRRTRLADSAVIGLLHIASVSTRMRGGHMVAPLAAVAVGGYAVSFALLFGGVALHAYSSGFSLAGVAQWAPCGLRFRFGGALGGVTRFAGSFSASAGGTSG